MHDTLLLFGATGDLAQRYLFPSLLHLLRDRLLPDTFRVVAVGRSEHDDAGFKQWLRERLEDGDDRDAAVVDDLLARIHYLSLDLNDAEAMRTALSPYADRPCVSYLSTPPDLFEPACRGLKRSEEHTSELQSLMRRSYAVFCMKKKKKKTTRKLERTKKRMKIRSQIHYRMPTIP